MKFVRLLVVLSAAVLSAAVALPAEPEYPKMGPDIYDTQADGAALVADAIAQAKATHKRILLDLGANWCIWCRRLKTAFETDPAIKLALADHFVLVFVDVNHRDNKSRNDVLNRYYENPVKEGLPVIVVLEQDGRQLTTQETGALENHKDGYDQKIIMTFLTKWTPKK
jgi:thiol:disulfide interchange protein